MKPGKFLTNKKTVITLFLLLTASFILANSLPQSGSLSGEAPRWISQNRVLSEIIRIAGLDAIFSTRWFFLIALVFFLSLFSSTFDQGKSAYLLTTRLPQPAAQSGFGLGISLTAFEAELKKLGYLKLSGAGDLRRHVKAPWGYWGNFLLHLGMTVTVLFSLVYVMTGHRTLVKVYQGDTVNLAETPATGVKSILTSPMTYPAAIRLETVRPEYWDNGVLKALGADLVFLDDRQAGEKVSLGVNAQIRVHEQTVYLNPKFGCAFSLDVAGGGVGMTSETLHLPMPSGPGKAVYGKADLFNGGYTLKAKYVGEAQPGDPLPQHAQLFLRMYQGSRLLGESRIGEGESCQLGTFLVRLNRACTFAELLFDSSRGVYGIFFGFFLTLCGALVLYCTVPREVVIREQEGGFLVWWRVAKFRDLYREEGERIMAVCRGQETI